MWNGEYRAFVTETYEKIVTNTWEQLLFRMHYEVGRLGKVLSTFISSGDT